MLTIRACSLLLTVDDDHPAPSQDASTTMPLLGVPVPSPDAKVGSDADRVLAGGTLGIRLHLHSSHATSSMGTHRLSHCCYGSSPCVEAREACRTSRDQDTSLPERGCSAVEGDVGVDAARAGMGERVRMEDGAVVLVVDSTLAVGTERGVAPT